MDNQLKSISKLFTEKLFRIPDYQRGYAWGEKQWKDFWSDIIQLEDGKNHYVGVLTFEEVPENDLKKWEDDTWIVKSKSFEPFYIVDGQQRLTTTLILLQCILETVEAKWNNTSINYNTVSEIRKRYIYDSKDNGISKSYIFGYEMDNPSYEYLKTEIFKDNSNSSYNKEETIYTNNLSEAKQFFLSHLDRLNFEDIENIFRKITQHFLYNIYSISSEIDVHVTFEGMNNRGKLLSVLELLKNRLIYLSTKFKSQSYEREALRKSINNSWKAVYHYLGRNKDNPLDDDQFLHNHFMVYFGHELLKNIENSKLDDNKKKFLRFHRFYRHGYSSFLLEQKFTLSNIESDVILDDKLTDETNSTSDKLSLVDVSKYVEDLNNTVQIWYHLHNPYGNNSFSDAEKFWIEKLNRADFTDFAPLLVVAYKKNERESELIELLKVIERFKFIFGLANYKYRRYAVGSPVQYLEVSMKYFHNEIDIKEVIGLVKEGVKKLLSKAEFLDSLKKDFQRHGFYKWDMITYFMFEYEESLKEASKTSRRKIDWHQLKSYEDDFVTIEHIYPQKAYKKCWTNNYKQFNSKQKQIIRDSLGNLLPLSRPKNSSFQNDCFRDKVIKPGESTIGFKYGCYSENEISDHSEWTSDLILERGVKLLTFMENRWGVKIGNRKDKIDFLNLGFLEKK